MKQLSSHYDGIPVLSYNAIFTEIITNRNYGKTWTFKRRAWRRALKHGKKTIWIRTFKKEVKEAVRSFYASSDLQKFCDITIYDAKTKKGNLKRDGNTFYYKRGNTWEWFLKVCALSDRDALRSADDVKVDTIVYDEFTTTAQRLRHYRGNLVDDFIDVFFSAKREHEVRCFLLGNKENVLNPFNAYFGVKPLPSTFEGIRSYRSGSLVIQQINNKPVDNSDYDRKVRALLHNTPYGRYIYEDAYKGAQSVKTGRPPKTASSYIQLDIGGNQLRIWTDTHAFYIAPKIDTSQRVFTLSTLNKYPRENLLIKRQKPYFIALVNALADNRVYYNSQATYEAVQPFYKWLSI